MLFGTESEILEFKETTGELKESIVSISSILNKHGKGEIYFGIKDNGLVIGQQIGERTLRDISQTISNHLKPQIFPVIDAVKIDDKRCIRVSFEGSEPPYFAFDRAYIRVADEDKKMSPEELTEFIRRDIEKVSSWDSSPSDIGLDDIDEEALKDYIEKANAVGRIDYSYSNKEDILKRLKLLKNGVLCNAANVMFGKDPDLQLQMAVFATDQKITFNDIFRTSGRIIDLVDFGEGYIKRNIRYRVVIDGSKLERDEIPEIPLVAIREALNNSYGHKNFRTPQNNEISIFSDRVEIYNPGTFPPGFTPEDFIERTENSVHRNPLLADLMYKRKDIESFGTGLKRISDACKEAGVRFEFQLRTLGFAVVFYRKPIHESEVTGSNTGSSDLVNDPVNDPVNQTALNILSEIKANGYLTYEELASNIGIGASTVKRNIKKLKDMGLIVREGSDKTGYWRVLS